tara:strand:+ start:265 stop:561 length:297 start_codon:yes stop_codon:yes gene_type:complete
MGYNEDDIGFQDNDASELAAQFNAAGKVTLREQVKQLFIVNKRLTAEQVSNLLQRAEISVKPRITELKNEGVIQNSGERVVGKWGTSITVWEVSPNLS